MSDNFAAGVLLDPFVDDLYPVDPPQDTEEPSSAPVTDPEPDPAPPAPPTDAAPAVDFEAQLRKKDEELTEQRRLAEFWAKKATGATEPPAPKPEEPAKNQLTKEEIADRLTEGDAEVLKEMGYVRREDVEKIAETIAEGIVQKREQKYESGAKLNEQYADYLNPTTDKYKAVAQEIQTNPTWKRIAEIDPDAALRGALEVVKSRIEAPGATPRIDYDKRIETQAGAKTKPAANNGVSTVATTSQKAAAEAIGIPIAEFMASVREVKGI